MGSCRCKMCGGHIHYDDNSSMATCEYCGTEQSVFRSDNEKQLKLFNRANSLRMQNEFDKAQLTYDNILIDDPNNAEAHWGICLCRYGIEYVDSPNGKKIPTCHRTAYKSIFDDLDYKEAIDNSDVVCKKYYENESKVIDRIQKEILSISQKEEPYDIFISYKENDNDSRTIDSIKAEEIYDELIKKGYRVFTHRKALALKEVSEYEPIIFAALMSSKVMITIGSKSEYFNSIWEKNEWSRFLSFMQDIHDKYLIPCYLDMEAFDIPDELLVFEAIDLKPSNYINTLLNRIEKYLNRNSKTITIDNRQTKPNNAPIDNMIERAKVSIEEGDFTKADEIIENILNIDYKCSRAYLLKVYTHYKAKNIMDLIDLKIDVKNNKDYQKALLYANKYNEDYLIAFSNSINEGIINKEKEDKYNKFINCCKKHDFKNGLIEGSSLSGYRDVDYKVSELKEKCYKTANLYMEKGLYEGANCLFDLVYEYKDSKDLRKKCEQLKIDSEKANESNRLCEFMDIIISRLEYEKPTFTLDDIDNYENYYNRVKVLKVISSDKIDYYGKKLLLVNKQKVKLERKANTRAWIIRHRRLLYFLIALVIVIAMILPIIILAKLGNSKGAGIACFVDFMIIVIVSAAILIKEKM